MNLNQSPRAKGVLTQPANMDVKNLPPPPSGVVLTQPQHKGDGDFVLCCVVLCCVVLCCVVLCCVVLCCVVLCCVVLKTKEQHDAT